jgi:hypothetical protein
MSKISSTVRLAVHAEALAEIWIPSGDETVRFIDSTEASLLMENQANVEDVRTIAETISIAIADTNARFLIVFFISLPP